jgi:hypothetical protein
VLIPLGADRAGDGKRKGRASKGHPREKHKKAEAAKARKREHERDTGLAEVHANQQAALAFLFGNVPLARKFRNVHDRAHYHEEAQKTIDALARSVKTLTLTCEGNVMVKEGDRVQARVPVSDKQTIKRDLFVKSVTHSMVPGDYSMELELAWREKDVDLHVEVPSEDLHRSQSSNSEAGEGTHGSPTGQVVTGKVSWFNGSATAGGKDANTDPGIALNLHPGTESGWNNATTQGWMTKCRTGKPVYARVEIAGHTAVLPIIDLGPAASTGRAIDVTQAGVAKLGFSTSNFPTDAVGHAHILG